MERKWTIFSNDVLVTFHDGVFVSMYTTAMLLYLFRCCMDNDRLCCHFCFRFHAFKSAPIFLTSQINACFRKATGEKTLDYSSGRKLYDASPPRNVSGYYKGIRMSWTFYQLLKGPGNVKYSIRDSKRCCF